MAETWDGYLNDINGDHIKRDHVFEALDSAKGAGPIEEGSVGGGTGVLCYNRVSISYCIVLNSIAYTRNELLWVQSWIR